MQERRDSVDSQTVKPIKQSNSPGWLALLKEFSICLYTHLASFIEHCVDALFL